MQTSNLDIDNVVGAVINGRSVQGEIFEKSYMIHSYNHKLYQKVCAEKRHKSSLAISQLRGLKGVI